MKTMTLIHTTEPSDDLLTMSNAELESWFAEAGLAVESVPHCDVAACPVCFMSSRVDTLNDSRAA